MAQTPDLVVGDVTQWTSLITSEHNQKPKFTTMLAAVLQPFADTLASENTMQALAFDLDQAIGSQLDIVGQWVGISRNLQLLLTGVYFAWDTVGLGWDQGAWLGPGDPATGAVTLPDSTYRTLLRARIANNVWAGNIPAAYAIGEIIFGRNPQQAAPFAFQTNNFTAGGGWTLTNCSTTAASAISPDATNDAVLWQRFSTFTAGLFITFTPAVPTNSLYSGSLSGKPGTGQFLVLRLQFSNSDSVDYCFDTLNGVIHSGPTIAGNVISPSASITPQGNGWFRCVVQGQGNTPGDQSAILAFTGNLNGAPTVDAPDSAPNTTILVYGARLAQEAVASPYQNDIAITDGGNMTMTITVRGPPLDSLTKQIIVNGFLDLKPAGVQATYVTP